MTLLLMLALLLATPNPIRPADMRDAVILKLPL
jgi:hypothetical protein